MSRTADLLYSLSIIITRYHAIELALPAGTEYDTTQQLLDKPHADMIAGLNELIEAATTRDATRKPLLMYILHQIDVLQSILSNPPVLEDDNLEIIQKKLIQFVTDIQALLQTSQSIELAIKYNGLDVKLYGLMRGALALYSPCTSGQILTETLFPALRLPINATSEKVAKTITTMLEELQHDVIYRTENDALHNENVSLKKTIESLQKELMKNELHESDSWPTLGGFLALTFFNPTPDSPKGSRHSLELNKARPSPVLTQPNTPETKRAVFY